MLADAVLAGLLARAEKRALSSDRTAKEKISELDAYWALSLKDRDAFHERMRKAEREGAIHVVWSKQGGEDRTADLISVKNVPALAAFLGTTTRTDVLSTASTSLAPWATNPRVRQILERWRSGKKIRKLGPASANVFVDALTVLDALARLPGEDQVVRRLSVKLFGDSKRIEKLLRPLDVLTNESLAAPARTPQELFNQPGLVKEPQPFLVAGAGTLRLDQNQLAPVLRPFLGVASKAIEGYSGTPAWVLSIENLTTFHLCSQLPQAPQGLIVYTGGMPSPAWATAYAKLLAEVSSATPVLHWGDIDAGGFRIAARIREVVPTSLPFLPWLMDPLGLPAGVETHRADPATLGAMTRHADRAGWSELAETLRPICVEQEALDPLLPGIDLQERILKS
ncbi:Wadjet anti-phage system protein JetD domain-containing protein [Stenotrophomonas sp. FSL W7-1447]|uniref:Wadjet anti-phage system protein JetD domain-containing protein n=1 Tax=Stenotrophomonas TaxID=40323 RepID=UPI0030CC5BCB